jgi:hypothetical protein
MALSDDQKAMLKLVAQPDTSYEDIAALMGLSVEDVRAKVEAALAELDQASSPTPAREEKAPVPPVPPRQEPKAEAPEPTPPAPAEKPTPAARPSRPRPSAARPRLKLPDDKGARLGLYAGVAVVVVLILLLVTGVLGGDDDSGEPATVANSGTETGSEGGEGQPTPTQAVLAEVGGSGASGRALFGRAGKNVVLLVRVKDLDPAPAGRSYTVSIAKSSSERVPLIATKTNKAGEIVGSFKIAPQILGLLASGFDQMEVSLVPDDELGTALKAAQKSGSAPDYGGTDVARGEVTGPIIEAGEEEEGG